MAPAPQKLGSKKMDEYNRMLLMNLPHLDENQAQREVTVLALTLLTTKENRCRIR